EQFVSGPMTERVIDDFEIVEIKNKKRPRSGLVAGQAGQCEIKARSIGELRQRIGMRQTLTLEGPLVAFESHGAQRDASIDYSLFRGGRAPVLAIVEGEGAQDAVVATANRRRPTCFKILAERKPPVVGPTGISLDIGHRDRGAQVGGGAAGADHWADRRAVDRGAILLGQAWACKWMQTAVVVQPQNWTDDVRTER